LGLAISLIGTAVNWLWPGVVASPRLLLGLCFLIQAFVFAFDIVAKNIAARAAPYLDFMAICNLAIGLYLVVAMIFTSLRGAG
jgi:hypothetical protein